VFIERSTIKLGKIECDGIGIVGVLAEQVMSSQMVPAKLDQLLWWRLTSIREDLIEDMGAELLNADLIVSSL
jgi:hypothetical protein